MDGLHGLAGWRWLFLLEGIPSVLLGLLVLAMLDDRIEDATWLSAREKAALSATIESVFPPRVLGGVAAAGGIALINSIGQIGGVIAPFMVGKVKDLTGSASMGLYTIALVCALAATLIAGGLPRRIYFRDRDIASSAQR